MDYYTILHIDQNSSTKDIKKHYYKLAKKYHPDKNNGISDENFKLLAEAYSILSNPKKRYLYDMKLLFKGNLGEDFINHFSDTELEILHDYYLRLKESTEFKFLKLLYESLPQHLKSKINYKFNYQKLDKKYSLLNLRDIKYIYANSINDNFVLNLNRSLKDVYQNKSKEIILITDRYAYNIYVTHSDYSLNFQIENHVLTIHIQTILPEHYSLNGKDIYYNHRINLYEYYFIDTFPIKLPNDVQINLKNSLEFNNSLKIPYLGLKEGSKRGDLYIYKNLDLMIHDKYQYESIIKEIFT
jgi:DnaJ-class molecular chaperone|tara:strand:- start:814 stop:1710 length:897 start_codon:yes stop_codon:yes gene_type:complete